MLSKSYKYLFLLLLSSAMLLTFAACGKKAMPKPPRYVEPPGVMDLVVENVENDVLTISWTLPASEEYNLRGFHVYLAQDALATLCLTCPLNFVQIGEGRGTTIDEVRQYSFQMRIQPGFRYVFKVNAVGREGYDGRDSNYAVFNYEAISLELPE